MSSRLSSLDITTLYNMAKAAAEAATNSANIKTQAANSPDFLPYGTYPVYINEYNSLLVHTYRLSGKEAQELFPPIDIGKYINPADTLGSFWKMYLDLAVVKLNTLVAYLQSKIPTTQKEIEAVTDLITAHLRASIFEDPKREREVQNVVEVMLRSRGYDYRREIVRIPYSSKTDIPDFTVEVLHLALEVKLCDSSIRVKELIDEINADIPPYQTRYKNVIFVIYDLGFIRDMTEFKGSIENNLNVHVIIIKK